MLPKKSLVAALLLTAALFSACAGTFGGNTDNSPSNVSRPAETSGSHPVDYENLTGEEWLNTVKAMDCEGYTFTIATSTSGRFTDYEDSENEVEKAVTRRNQLVESRYNIKIEEKTARESKLINELQSSVQAGLQYADLISATMPTLARLAAGGLLTNLHSLAYYDYTAEFCSSALMEGSAVSHTDYVTFDDLAMTWESAWCVLFNKSLVNGDELYAAAKDGSWTWDKLLETAADGGFASYGDTDEVITTTFATSGVTPLINGYGIPLSHNSDTEKLDSVAAKIRELVGSNSYRTEHYDNAKNAFENGKLKLLIAPVELISIISDTPLNFGLLPLPTFDGVTRSVLDTSARGIAVPAMQTDSDRTGLLLTALTAASYQHIEAADLQNHIYFHLSDNESALMLRKIYDTLYLNAGILYSGGYAAVEASSQNAILEAVKNGKAFADIFRREKTQLEDAAKKYFR